MADHTAGPKKTKPKGLGQKPVKKPVKDAEMNEEQKEPKAPPKRPVLSSDKPKAAGGAGKAPSAPVVHEEDLGSGLSKEEAIDKVNDYFDASNVAKFEDAKW
jgi:hypothetical protein